MTPWHELESALEARARPLTLWWRDDDAGRFHPQLETLLALAERQDAPLALAVVPAWLEPAVTTAILATPHACVLQHGYAHADHAPPGAKRIELGGTGDPDTLCADLARGRERLAAAFGARFLPVLAPPWNRIDRAIAGRLPGLGFAGLSAFGPGAAAAPAVRQVDTHLDLQDWKRGGVFAGGVPLLARLAELIASVDDEPLGLLTHHRRMDAAAFEFLERLLTLLRRHPQVRFVPARALFEAPA